MGGVADPSCQYNNQIGVGSSTSQSPTIQTLPVLPYTLYNDDGCPYNNEVEHGVRKIVGDVNDEEYCYLNEGTDAGKAGPSNAHNTGTYERNERHHLLTNQQYVRLNKLNHRYLSPKTKCFIVGLMVQWDNVGLATRGRGFDYRP